MATKDITDLMVCEAYRGYRVALDAEIGRRGARVLGILPPDGGECPFPYEILMKRTGLSFKECYRAMERAYDRGLIECGVSLRTGWLTEKGESLLKTARKGGAL